MKKYIRTKETDCCIIDTIKYKEITGENCFIPKNEIVDEANTIEELCDEFIVVSDNCEKPIISALPFNELKIYAKNRTKYANCYGAIWTECGLKYIAKMNSKGELELL